MPFQAQVWQMFRKDCRRFWWAILRLPDYHMGRHGAVL